MEHFCTCADKKCPFHPSNHNEGCDPCIKKNLRVGEIPSCFFKLVNEDISQNNDFSIKGFNEFYKKHAKKKNPH
jgi:hypothetical protein